MGIKASSQVTIIDVTDAYSVNLTSDSYTFVGDSAGAPAGLTCTTQIIAYCGTELCQKVHVSDVQCPKGISATIIYNDIDSPIIEFTTEDVIDSSCEAMISCIAYGDNSEASFLKMFSFAVAKEGAAGADGQMLYATCDTGATTKTKIANLVNGSLSLKTGVTISVKFTNTNDVQAPLLNVAGTGAKPILVNGGAMNSSSYYWDAGSIVPFVYNGSGWNVSDASSLSKAMEASKTATSFMEYDSANGLQIGNKISGSWSGYRTQVKSDSFNVLDQNGSVLSSFGANLIELGKNNTNAVISLCGDLGRFEYYKDSDNDYEFLKLESDKMYYMANQHVMDASGLTTTSVGPDGSSGTYYLAKSSSLELGNDGSCARIQSSSRYAESDGTPIGTAKSTSSAYIDPFEIDLTASDSVSINIPSASISIDNGVINLNANDCVKVNGNVIDSGTWTPSCYSISSPTQAFGSYMKIGKNVTISFCIYGAASSSTGSGSFSLRITNLPFTPDTSVRWYGGGGNVTGVTTPANHVFSGYCIESNSTYGTLILPRTIATSTSAATRSSSYCTNPGSGTIYMAGTIMYRTA